MSKTKDKKKYEPLFLSMEKAERYRRAMRGEEDPIERQRRLVRV